MNKWLTAALIGTAMYSTAQIAPAVANNTPDHIVVHGQGATQVVPDTMQFTMWVEAAGNQLSPLKTQVDQITATLLRDFQARDVKREDIRSFQLSISPRYKREDDRSVQDGFQVSRQIEVTLRDTDNFDTLIDFALAQGVTRVGSIQYRVGEPTEASQQALLNAIEDAHRKGALMAKHSDRSLGSVISIREQSSGGHTPVYRMAASSMSMDVSEPGQQSIQARVEVTFRLD